MKVGRQLAMIMAAMMALGSPLSVCAQEIDASGGTGSGSADTNFSVDAETLGGGLVVLIPDEIVLEYNEGEAVFEKTSQITAKGFVEVDKHLEVSVPTDIEYALENFDAITAAGTVTFGSTVDDNQVESWTQTELKTKDGDSVIGVAKDITVEVPESNVLDIGTYRSVLSFNIELLGETSNSDLVFADFTYRFYNQADQEITLTGLKDDATVSGALNIPKDWDMPAGWFDIVEIADNAFSGNEDITSVKFSTTVKFIGDNAFANCSNLTSVTVGDVEYTDISELTDALTGAGVTVGTDAFTGTALTE